LQNFAILQISANTSKDLVAQPGREKVALEKEEKEKSPRWDLNPRPKVSALPQHHGNGVDRRLTKPSLCQAELLGQKTNATSTPRYLMLHAEINNTKNSFLV
jgi:hypothetical protein